MKIDEHIRIYGCGESGAIMHISTNMCLALTLVVMYLLGLCSGYYLNIKEGKGDENGRNR